MTALPAPVKAGNRSHIDPLLKALHRYHSGSLPPGVNYVPEEVSPPGTTHITKNGSGRRVRDLAREDVARVEQILVEVARDHKVGVRDLISHYKGPHLVRARYQAYWRLRTELDLSLRVIAALMKRDHKAIFHGIQMTAKTFLDCLGRSA